MQKEIKTNVPCLRMYRQHDKTYVEVRRDINFRNEGGSGLMLEFRDFAVDTYVIRIDPIQYLSKEKKIKEDWEQAYVLSKTLSRLFSYLYTVGDKRPVGITVRKFDSMPGRHGCYFNAYFRGEIASCFKNWGSKEKGRVSQAVMETYNSFFNLQPRGIADFKFETEDYRLLYLSCPGSEGVCLHRATSASQKGNYFVNGHNIDNPAHQIALLAGLAEITSIYEVLY